MRVLVMGGTGTVGSEVVRELLRCGATVRVMTRSAEKAKEIPQGAQGVVADLSIPATLPLALKDVEGVFLCTALSQNETEQGLAAVSAARAAGVRHLVYLSVHQVEKGPHIPHFKSKLPIEKAIQDSGMDYTLLQPNNFFQNDRFFKEPIIKFGVYPQPIGNVGLSRVDVRDIADAAANALLNPGHSGRTYPVVGAEVLTGDDVAKIYSRHLDREVRYAGDDLDAWAEQARKMLPEWMVYDLRIMYQHFQQRGLIASQADLDAQAKLLGHPPRSFDAYVVELTTSWRN